MASLLPYKLTCIGSGGWDLAIRGKPLFSLGFPGSSDSKESACNAGDEFDPWVGKIPWRREWQPPPVFLPEEFHEQRSLVG